MKTPEILLASALVALVAGAAAAFASRAFLASSARTASAQPEGPRLAESPSDPSSGPGELAELRQAQTQLLQRVAALEARLSELASVRTESPLDPGVPQSAARTPSAPPDARPRELDGPVELSEDFVASVERALTRIQAAEEKERDQARKELQAQRIEERVTRLQQELGLTNRQASDLRTALITQDDRRETLFSGMREGTGDPLQAREGFRTLRDETHAELQRILTPEQYAAYQRSEEAEFGRRGFGEGGPPGRPPGEGGFGRPR